MISDVVGLRFWMRISVLARSGGVDNVSAAASPPSISTIDLPYEGPSAREARRWTRGVLAGFVDDETIDDVVRCIAELVSNSQVHTSPNLDRKDITCQLKIASARRVTRIRGAVIDAGSPDKVPTCRPVGAGDVTGRGLSQVVRRCADAWEYERTPMGEGVMWFKVTARRGGFGIGRKVLRALARSVSRWSLVWLNRPLEVWHLVVLNHRFPGWRCSLAGGRSTPDRWTATRRSPLESPYGDQANTVAADTHKKLRRTLAWQQHADVFQVPREPKP